MIYVLEKFFPFYYTIQYRNQIYVIWCTLLQVKEMYFTLDKNIHVSIICWMVLCMYQQSRRQIPNQDSCYIVTSRITAKLLEILSTQKNLAKSAIYFMILVIGSTFIYRLRLYNRIQRTTLCVLGSILWGFLQLKIELIKKAET